ncbi:MAG: alpha/beta fold hydrolase [Chloroflexi bacterium]|nr:alpha/beta fold hydrolase [Chloroflexota bacterium]
MTPTLPLTPFRQVTPDGAFAGSRAGAGEPQLLIHSLGTSRRLFADVIPPLAAHRDVICPDILGHGESDKPRREFSIPDHAGSLVRLLDAVNVDSAHVAGTSLGALIGLEMAASFPERVKSLTLNGAPGWHLESQRMARLQHNSAAFITPDGLPREVAAFGTARPLGPQLLTQVNEDLRAAGRWMLSSMWAIAAFDIMPRLPRVAAPTLVLMGEFDYYLPTVEQLLESIPNSRLLTVPGAGHLTPYDDPEAFAAAVAGLHGRR